MLLGVVAVVALALFITMRVLNARAQAAAASAKAGPHAIPVVTVKAARGNMDIFLTGLGTVTPLATDTVHSRVDGQIMKVYYTEGQDVHVDDPLVEIDPRPYQAQLEQAQGQLAKDQASLQNAQADLKRFQTLYAQNYAVTQQQVDTQTALVAQSEGTVQVDKAQVNSAKLNITYCHITSPINGRVGLRLVDVGNLVHATDTSGLLVITELHPITVVFTLAQQNITRVVKRQATGQPIVVEAWDSSLTTKLAAGTVVAIDNQVDPSTGTFRVRAQFANENNLLFPNEFVNARLLVDTEQNVIIIPTAGVQRGPDSLYAYVAEADNTVDLKTIQAGPSEGDFTVIRSGLEAGEMVVTEGVDKLQKGSSVQPHEQARPPARRRSRPGGRRFCNHAARR